MYSFVDMIHEFSGMPSGSHQETPKPKRLASSRAVRAMALATGLSIMGNADDAEAKKKRPQHTTQSVESRSGDAKKEYPDLNGRKDHGMEKEIEAAEHFGLKNFKSVDEIQTALEEGRLVELDPSDEDTYVLDSGIGELVQPETRHFFHCVLPYVKERLESISYEFYARFKSKLIVNSLIRTEKYQDRLRKGNSNTSQGYTSSHLKGSTVDIAYFGPETERRPTEYRMTPVQQEWLDARLLLLEKDGWLQVTKEKNQPVYHVMFYPEKYKK